MKKITKKIAIGITATAAFTLLGTGIWAYAAPHSYVSLDVNPSIEYTLNAFERVIDVEAVNDDGQEILVDVGRLKNLSIKAAITKTINQLAEEGYITKADAVALNDNTQISAATGGAITAEATPENTKNDESTTTTTAEETAKNEGNDIVVGGIVISVSNKSEVELSEDLMKKIRETVESVLNPEVQVEVMSVGYARVQEARKMGVTPGKLNLVEKLKASSSDPNSIVVTEWINKPVKDIMQAIKANRSAVALLAAQTEEKVASPTDANATLSVDASTLLTDQPALKEESKASLDDNAFKKDKSNRINKKYVVKLQDEDEDDGNEADNDDADENNQTNKEIKKAKKEAAKAAKDAAKDAYKSAVKQAKDAYKLANEVNKENRNEYMDHDEDEDQDQDQDEDQDQDQDEDQDQDQDEDQDQDDDVNGNKKGSAPKQSNGRSAAKRK